MMTAETADLFLHLDADLADCRAAMLRLDAKAEAEERDGDTLMLLLAAKRGA